MLPRDLLDIDKMRELDKASKKKEKPPKSPQQATGATRILDWDKLKDNYCPRCGFSLKEDGVLFKCQWDSFTISKTRLLEIQREMKEKEDFAFPDQL